MYGEGEGEGETLHASWMSEIETVPKVTIQVHSVTLSPSSKQEEFEFLV